MKNVALLLRWRMFSIPPSVRLSSTNFKFLLRIIRHSVVSGLKLKSDSQNLAAGMLIHNSVGRDRLCDSHVLVVATVEHDLADDVPGL